MIIEIFCLQGVLTLHSPGPMGSLISLKETITGDSPMAGRMPTILSLSAKGLMGSLIILMLRLFGLGMGRSIFSKAPNIGGLTLTSAPLSRAPIHALSQTGREYQTI